MRKLAVLIAAAAAGVDAGGELPCRDAAKGRAGGSRRGQRRVDITIDGQPFTSYIWPTTLKKPVLYPIMDADGVTLTRGWPLAPRPGERTDHPHHDGLWFNYSNVNGFRFLEQLRCHPAQRALRRWARSSSTRSSPPRAARRVASLSRDSTWIDGQNHPILAETTHTFSRTSGRHAIIDLIVDAEGARPCCLQRRQGRHARPARRALA